MGELKRKILTSTAKFVFTPYGNCFRLYFTVGLITIRIRSAKKKDPFFIILQEVFAKNERGKGLRRKIYDGDCW